MRRVWHGTILSVREVLAAMGTFPTAEGGKEQEGERKKYSFNTFV